MFNINEMGFFFKRLKSFTTQQLYLALLPLVQRNQPQTAQSSSRAGEALLEVKEDIIVGNLFFHNDLHTG